MGQRPDRGLRPKLMGGRATSDQSIYAFRPGDDPQQSFRPFEEDFAGAKTIPARA